MAAGVDQTLNDHMTRVQIRLAKERLNGERNRYVNSTGSFNSLDGQENDHRLQDVVMRRKRLLGKIAEEKQMQKELRSVSDLDWNFRSPSPGRKSLPPIWTDQHIPYNPGIGQYPQFHAPPIAPHPRYLPHNPYDFKTNTKQEMIEMMMMQNAQMHQMMMSHMMMTSLPKHTDNKDTVPLSIATELIGAKLNRPPSVHHHHYEGRSSSPFSQFKPLPNISSQTRNQQPEFQSKEVQPLLPPVETYRGRQRKRKPPFPGPYPLRKFRHAALAVLFCEIVKTRHNSYRKTPIKTENKFFFAIRIKEIVSSLHRIYLDSDKKIKPLLSRLIYDESLDLINVLEERNSKIKQEAISNLSTLVEDFVFRITEIMPASGMLGTYKKSAVYALIQPGQLFPTGYFWNIEKTALDEQNGRLASIDERSSLILLSGMFIGRCLVATLLLKPSEYDIIEKGKSRRAERNVKMLATALVYVLRKTYVSARDKPLAMPFELSSDLFPDDVMSTAYKKMKRSIDYAVQLLREWAKEYTKRLRNT